jgi:hypothetical protein
LQSILLDNGYGLSQLPLERVAIVPQTIDGGVSLLQLASEADHDRLHLNVLPVVALCLRLDLVDHFVVSLERNELLRKLKLRLNLKIFIVRQCRHHKSLEALGLFLKPSNLVFQRLILAFL